MNVPEDLLKIILKNKLKQLGESFILGEEDHQENIWQLLVTVCYILMKKCLRHSRDVIRHVSFKIKLAKTKV